MDKTNIIYVDFAITICSVIFCLFLMIIYFSKKNVNNIENRIYRFLLIFNFLNSSNHVLFGYLLMEDKYLSCYNFTLFIDSLRLALMLVYYFLLASYIIIVCFPVDSKINKFIKKNSVLYFLSIPTIINVFQFILPLHFTYDSKNALFVNSGPANTYWFIIAFLLMFICIFTILYNRKNMDRKKLIPFFILVILSLLCFLYSLIGSVIQLVATLVSYLMYHTIENPDMKLITELEFAKDQAEKSNNAKSDFLSSMSHELRTPLNAIVGLSQMIVSSNDVEEMHNDGMDILKSSNNLLELVDSILSINKIDSNDMDIVESNYNPIDLFDELVKLTHMRIGDKSLELNTRFSDKIPNTLYGDKDKLKTIINNLLTNAVKYTESGFVEFNVDCTIKEDICNLRINVSDSGRGIKDDQLDKPFTKFYRLEEDKDSNIEGTGLGLALSKSLLDLMGGKITVNSEEGIGTTFNVTLNQKIINNDSYTEIL